jgi:glycosyltransferase involved in cell wall biosynthesis
VRGIALPFYPEVRVGLATTGRLCRLWLDACPDVVYVATEGPLGAAAVGAARRLAIPAASGFHTNFDAYSRDYRCGWLARPIRGYLRWLHNRTALTLVPTETQRAALAAAGFANVAVLERGVDAALFDPARRDPVLRRTWGVHGDAPVLMHVGRLAAEKNLGLLMSAFAAVRTAVPEARAVVVGDGPSRRALERDHPDVHFCGVRRGSELATHYASGDLFLFPSLTETFGNVVLEALASGLPPVAFDRAAAGMLVEDGVSGLLTAPGDDAGFIAAAVRAASDGSLRQRLRGRARAVAERRGWPSIIDRFEQQLAGLAGPEICHASTLGRPVRTA